MKTRGKLYLFPVPIAEENGIFQIPPQNVEIIKKLRHFIAEDAKSARRFLKLCSYPDIGTSDIKLLNEHSEAGKISDLLAPLFAGESAGMMSEAGCPGIADPGQELILLAHCNNVEVIPLGGPSAILLSIMSSGFNGQNFAFNGYLPVDKLMRARKIKELEQLSARTGQSQFFIETPYRNRQMLETLLETLSPHTYLFIGKSLLSPAQFLKSETVAEWKKAKQPELHKEPVVFGIHVLKV